MCLQACVIGVFTISPENFSTVQYLTTVLYLPKTELYIPWYLVTLNRLLVIMMAVCEAGENLAISE